MHACSQQPWPPWRDPRAHQSQSLVECNLCVQPDKGALCALWVAALISALEDKRSSCNEFRLHAVRVLVATCYVYSGHIVPRPLRARLLVALQNGWRCTPQDPLQISIQASSTALLVVLEHDEVFAPLIARESLCVDILSDDSVKAQMVKCVAGCLDLSGAGWLRTFSRQRENDAMHSSGVHHVQAAVSVRGAGLVASAYGMLHCQDTVRKLLATWRTTPWSSRLDSARDVLVLLQRTWEVDWEMPSKSETEPESASGLGPEAGTESGSGAESGSGSGQGQIQGLSLTLTAGMRLSAWVRRVRRRDSRKRGRAIALSTPRKAWQTQKQRCVRCSRTAQAVAVLR
jgi:hypothetical protein